MQQTQKEVRYDWKIYGLNSFQPIWQYLFPSVTVCFDKENNVTHRHHLNASVIQKAVKIAVRKAGIMKQVGYHTFRHSLATHLLDPKSAMGWNRTLVLWCFKNSIIFINCNRTVFLDRKERTDEWLKRRINVKKNQHPKGDHKKLISSHPDG